MHKLVKSEFIRTGTLIGLVGSVAVGFHLGLNDLAASNGMPLFMRDLAWLYPLLMLVTLGNFLFGRSTQKQLTWYMAASTTRIAQIEARFASGAPSPAPSNEASWPWGGHHTELLGQLEAAAKQFWCLYDPSEPDTAPTNAMVAEWLYERGVSKEKAQAIASILRADGLRTGPRRG